MRATAARSSTNSVENGGLTTRLPIGTSRVVRKYLCGFHVSHLSTRCHMIQRDTRSVVPRKDGDRSRPPAPRFRVDTERRHDAGGSAGSQATDPAERRASPMSGGGAVGDCDVSLVAGVDIKHGEPTRSGPRSPVPPAGPPPAASLGRSRHSRRPASRAGSPSARDEPAPTESARSLLRRARRGRQLVERPVGLLDQAARDRDRPLMRVRAARGREDSTIAALGLSSPRSTRRWSAGLRAVGHDHRLRRP